MKAETKRILKERNKLSLYTDKRFETTKYAMKQRMAKDVWLRGYLSLDPLNRAEWCADHLISWAENGLI